MANKLEGGGGTVAGPLKKIRFLQLSIYNPDYGLDLNPRNWVKLRDEDPVLALNRIRGSVPQTQGDF